MGLLSVLPAWLQPIGLALPIMYWLGLIRRSLLGAGAAVFPTYAQITTGELLAILAGMTKLYGVLAVFFFRWAENRTRRRVPLDVETQF